MRLEPPCIVAVLVVTWRLVWRWGSLSPLLVLFKVKVVVVIKESCRSCVVLSSFQTQKKFFGFGVKKELSPNFPPSSQPLCCPPPPPSPGRRRRPPPPLSHQ